MVKINKENMAMVTCYIALGSNLNTPVEQLKRAKTALASMPQSCLLRSSSLYQSEALTETNHSQNDEQNTADYINAVVEVTTTLKPLDLLDKLQQIEKNQGRIRHLSHQWSSRTIDLDLLLYGDHVINNERLTVPHYDMKKRNFVITPLLEINPELKFPDGSAAKILLPLCRSGVLIKFATPF